MHRFENRPGFTKAPSSLNDCVTESLIQRFVQNSCFIQEQSK